MRRYFLNTLTFLFVFWAVLWAEEYHCLESDENMVKFISNAPIEDFEGVTSNIDGYLYWEGDDLTNKSEFYFEVDLNTLDTGIGLRNRHMQENYLETGKYPKTHLKGKITAAKKISEKEFQITGVGTMFIHGQEQAKTITANLIFEGDIVMIKCNFDVKLSDYNIEIPSIMFYKIDEKMRLELNFSLKKAADKKE